MGLRNDLATKRDVRGKTRIQKARWLALTRALLQVSAFIAVIVSVLYFAFSISQLVAVDQSQRQPTYVELVYTSSQIMEFPRFVVCPKPGSVVPSGIANLTCILYKFNPARETMMTSQQTTETLFLPRSLNTTLQECFQVTPSQFGATSASVYDYIDCTAVTTSGNDVLVQFYGSDSSSEQTTSTSNFDWVPVYDNGDANIGLKLVRYLDPSGTITKSLWAPKVLYQSDPNPTDPAATSFTIQFTDNTIQSFQEHYAYSFWIGMGVIGGAGVVFYGIHFVLTYFAFQVLGIKKNSTTNGTGIGSRVNSSSNINAAGHGGRVNSSNNINTGDTEVIVAANETSALIASSSSSGYQGNRIVGGGGISLEY